MFYSDNGSTAVEVALKMALQYWQQADGGAQKQRTAFLTFGSAYHGDTIGSVSLGGIDLFHERYRPLLFQTIRAPSPALPPPPGALEALEALVIAEPSTRAANRPLAAVVLEPGMQGAAGMVDAARGLRRGACGNWPTAPARC